MNVELMFAEKVANCTFTDFELWISNNFRQSCSGIPGGYLQQVSLITFT